MDALATCLWFDRNGEEAANFYVDLFPDSRIDEIFRAPTDYPAGKAGDVLMITFTLAGRAFQALNGGDFVRPNESMSISVACETQAEVDRCWNALSAHPESEQCGWLKDRFGVSWQIVPNAMMRLLGDADRDRAARAMRAMMDMKKLDIAALERAAAGSNGGS